jgi:hypothetical protein
MLNMHIIAQHDHRYSRILYDREEIRDIYHKHARAKVSRLRRM